MAFVVDASVAASWFLPDETNVPGDRLMRRLREEVGHIPMLFWAEMRHLLLTAERRGRLRGEEPEMILRQLRQFSLYEHLDKADGQTLQLARRYALSAYDATYLSLAVSNRIPLATFDRKLALAAAAFGLALV